LAFCLTTPSKAPQRLSAPVERSTGGSFEVMPDGKHVVLIPPAEQKQATHATFLLNFMDDLWRRVPAGK
jgi:hypothetical protein